MKTITTSSGNIDLNKIFPELLWWEEQDEVALPVKQEQLLDFDWEFEE